MKNINLFSSQSDYESATLTYPNLSLIKETGTTYSHLEDPLFVDLGLPSGTLWMKYNIGATSETDKGLFFQWGDTVGHRKGDDAAKYSTWATSPCNGGNSTMNEEAISVWLKEHTTNGNLNNDVDAAYVHTNGKAKMPTKEQIEELLKYGLLYNDYVYNKNDKSKYIILSEWIGNYLNGFLNTIGTYFRGSTINTDYTITAIFSEMADGVERLVGEVPIYYSCQVRGVKK